jgi:APA family basic amino acid/polyamine antiporter
LSTITANEESPPTVPPRLGLWDAISIIVGIVVGTTIFRGTAPVFANAGGPWTALSLWLVGGILSWCGAVCYAELATTYPRDGGDYEYLNRAFGPWCGFLFGWSQLATIISGNIAIMAYAFADYGAHLWPALNKHAPLVTIAPVIALSALNAVGLAAGKTTQNLLTAAKVLGIGGIVLAGLSLTLAKAPTSRLLPFQTASSGSLSLALVFVLYAFGGWAHAAYVAAEVRDLRRNLPRALGLGIAGITLIYLIVNATYVYVLQFGDARSTPTPAADVMDRVFGPWGTNAVSVLVMLSALGAINGMILTGTRIYAVWAADYPSLNWLATWNRQRAVPFVAITVQALVAVFLILLVGSYRGRQGFNLALSVAGIQQVEWERFNGGFETLVVGSAPIFWLLTFLTSVSVFVLRYRDRSVERPFKVPMFPLPILVFGATCIYMLYASLDYARWLSLIGFIPAAVGLIVWFTLRKRNVA